MDELSVIDVSGLDGSPDARRAVGDAIDRACRSLGFFCITGHGVPPAQLAELDRLAREFFALDRSEQELISMERGGRSWRGWFPLGAEVTSGRPDGKSGLYFGSELGPDDPRVRAGLPLHGSNLFPARPAALRAAVLGWIETMTQLGQRVLRGMALGLGLDEGWFAAHLTADPTVLFRIFHYPPSTEGWGVGEHTDYGLITLLAQDDRGGLQVRTGETWLDVPGRSDLFVCNLGDMLDRMTAGRYRSTPHRVRNVSGRDRLSFPFFLDPSWDAEVAPIELGGIAVADDATSRWDGTSLRELEGTYGEYLLRKVRKVFPALAEGQLS